MVRNEVYTMLDKLTKAVKDDPRWLGSKPYVEISVAEWRAIPSELAVEMFGASNMVPVLNGVNVLVLKEGK